MNTAVIVLGIPLVAFLLYRLVRQSRDEPDDEPMTAWNLVRVLLAPLGVGLYLLCMTLVALVRGEIACGGKGGCPVAMYLRAEHTGPYWANVAFSAVGAGLLLWLAWRSFRRWREDR